ncbi:helix-turn-helix transcriptional regulator [Loktanella salsilacus]|jgi:transcriptional regulator with XRE-family HTH domain|uniref:Transcriptional regulator, contains XRE-family HTH domain n=1 Tax=Loktanella salsilacus TaxID=195913 RepID=A0A1I4EU86_9RHOB|nr:helix-turn-helix transcriptional regulator [Loktanella salsilacus]MBU0780557.1 helix-turn-helix domain-containing protein [Alphaproteobacteria bacterium]MBU1835951.1 helix-turn-helix domain-containing protein [Alphaproteobacteria bacterium]UTH45205.1 helix-turn-helix transcriptional regulator [Loktanella salsilacus]UTH49015.1 helix-turn-helix transcriptional regulator [Loktanella salsilacus]SFL08076.1 Transcriptional regulator, contains XRE-family HTH domain [Loktanella salsilacus]|tara:strand:+ start:594 stop:983 length:390 start_codon:yes stop_codon:yes gene_type:complete
MPDSDWYSDEAATFGDRLTAAREAADLTVDGLATRLGVKVSTLAGWEQDVKEPRANRLQMLAGMLGVSLTWLLTGQGDGLLPPSDDTPADTDARALLAELRDLRLSMAASADRLARLEKRLREKLKDDK